MYGSCCLPTQAEESGENKNLCLLRYGSLRELLPVYSGLDYAHKLQSSKATISFSIQTLLYGVKFVICCQLQCTCWSILIKLHEKTCVFWDVNCVVWKLLLQSRTLHQYSVKAYNLVSHIYLKRNEIFQADTVIMWVLLHPAHLLHVLP